ncbi:MAG TPA: zinc ribbon domain-containing protein [Candidatus Binataceae bacterium]|nr:zinc ribbon domain-containing protein [Candidatus Binataceae bacterium]
MPIYEYRCRDCEHEFEIFVMASAPAAACPDCGSEQLTRELSSFASHAEQSSSGSYEGSGPVGGGGCCGGACGCGH